MFMLTDIRHELEEAARQMPGPQKINMMLFDFSTPEFRAFVTAGVESDTLPQNPARDFFLHNLEPTAFFGGIDANHRTAIVRKLNELAHLLAVTKMQFALEASDWRSLTRIMLTCVVSVYKAKVGKQELPKFVQVLSANLGSLTEDEQLSMSILLSFA